jgi:hypothetical protein
MSNPGVLTLTSKKIGSRKKFRVEDNLGEAIHLHYNNIRIDLTIQELLELSDICDDTIYDLVKAQNFDLDDYDCSFLLQYAKCFLDLTEVRRQSVPMKDVRVLTKNALGIPVTKPLHRLKGNGTQTKEEDGYCPVIFNNSPILVYGQENALAQYAADQDGNLEVLNLIFEKNKYSVSEHPWVDFFFHWDKHRIKEICMKLAKKLMA